MLGGGVDMNIKETDLCLGLPGGGDTAAGNKRGFLETVDLKLNLNNEPRHYKDLGSAMMEQDHTSLVAVSNDKSSCRKDPSKPPAKAQVVGWPPVRSYRKNMMVLSQKTKFSATEEEKAAAATFVKVSMDGAPYLRKVDLKMYKSYEGLSNALGEMFNSFTTGKYGTRGMIDFMNERKLMDLLNSSDYVSTYEDKDGDWMLVGDVPWDFFVESCKRLRIRKGSEAIGLAPRAMEKCNNRA